MDLSTAERDRAGSTGYQKPAGGREMRLVGCDVVGSGHEEQEPANDFENDARRDGQKTGLEYHVADRGGLGGGSHRNV